jgi:hypothetical protein
MDDALYTDDLDLAAIRARDDLLAMLRLIRIRADNPSVRTLEARTRHSTAPVSKTVVSQTLRGARFPAEAAMVSFLRACGGPEVELEPWRRARERVVAENAPGDPPLAAEQTETSQLQHQVNG